MISPVLQQTDKIFKGLYLIKNEEYFRFFKTNPDFKTGTDVITKEVFNLSDFFTVNFAIDDSHYKYVYNSYQKDKNNIIFKNNTENIQKNQFYFKTLRFFDLNDSDIIFQENVDKEILDNVILKIQKFSKRYMGKKLTEEYVKQLKHFTSIIEVLSFLPDILVEKIKPFWIEEIIQNKHVDFLIFKIKDAIMFNTYNISLFKNFSNREENIQEIDKIIEHFLNTEDFIYKKKRVDMLSKIINEAKKTLSNETEIAIKYKDEDLLKEINIILDEIKTVENNLNNIDFYNVDEFGNYLWWPEILYPIKNILDIAFRNEISSVENMKYCYISIFNHNQKMIY
jgi:hypothetical protein